MKKFKEQNSWAIILGGSSGLGLASAKKLAKHSINICIIHRDRKSDLNKIKKVFDEIINEGVKFVSYNLDALNPEKRKEIISGIKKELGKRGKVKILLHSIAKGNLKPMIDEKIEILRNEDFKLTIDAMAVSLYDWVQELFQNELFASDARVISFTSEGSSKAWKNYGAISASKAALEAITRNIALEFAPFGIRANCILAGTTDTKSFRMIPGNKQLSKYAKIRNPFNRLTTPEDVADVVYLLSLDEASWINGTVIPVNGGEHLS